MRRALIFLSLCGCGVQQIEREKTTPTPTPAIPPLPGERPVPCALTGEQRLSFSLWQDDTKITIKDATATLRPAPFSLWLCFHQDGDVALNASLSDALLQYASHGGALFSSSDCTEYDARCDTPVSQGGFLGPFDGYRTFAHHRFHSEKDILLADDSVNSYYYSSPDDYDFNEASVKDGIVTGRIDIEVFVPDESVEKRPIATLAGQSLYLVLMSRNETATIERQRNWLTLRFGSKE